MRAVHQPAIGVSKSPAKKRKALPIVKDVGQRDQHDAIFRQVVAEAAESTHWIAEMLEHVAAHDAIESAEISQACRLEVPRDDRVKLVARSRSLFLRERDAGRPLAG